MDLLQFKTSVIPGETLVICPEPAYDMEEGWDEEMNDMVGIPLLVSNRSARTAHIMSANGNLYMFGYKYIELFNMAQTKLRLNNNTFSIKSSVTLRMLDSITLGEDRKALRTLSTINMDTGVLEVTSEVLKEIQEKCPRIIGALLSYKIMERVV